MSPKTAQPNQSITSTSISDVIQGRRCHRPADFAVVTTLTKATTTRHYLACTTWRTVIAQARRQPPAPTRFSRQLERLVGQFEVRNVDGADTSVPMPARFS